MSSTFPPDGPPEDPSSGQPGPEYLEQGRGGPIAPEPATSGGGLRKGLIAGGAILGFAVVGGGVWAAASFLGQGPQPAEALPASTIGYASIDLDPSGGQKIEAIQMLRKFPAFKEEIGLDTDDDIKEKLFDEMNLDEECDGLDYKDDFEPWLGDRMAVAAVDTGEKMPSVVGVVQVTDADAAEDSLAKLWECDGAGEEGGLAIEGDWALIAETDDIAQDIADEAAEGSLADDDTYQRWTEEVGDAGVVNMYAAPEVGKLLAENLEGMLNPFGAMAGVGSAYSSDVDMSFDDENMTEDFPTDEDFPAEPALPEEMTKALKDFEGMAATLRFDDGALEFEVAGDTGVAGDMGMIYDTDGGDDMISTLPENTAAAVGVGFADGWFSKVLDQVASYSGGQMSVDDLVAEAEAVTGLDLPDDAETLAGESAALAISADIDPEALMNSDSPEGLPIGVKVKGEPEEIEGVLDKIRSQMGTDADLLISESDDDVIAIGADDGYVSELLENGNLGDSDAFKNVIREADQASSIFFVNFDAGDGWLAELAGDDEMAKENLEPLEGLGLSAWQDDDVAHGVLRLTTN